ncbi:crystallin, lamda 1, isoform CRA_c [Rattus norvegicus]|nr:crystallin, lamda 1, isoform CRA_c [Rattus norvegicus]EDM14348.1 crystallin, lamda 1, isoform CRA_c [Rattus norvegicus]
MDRTYALMKKIRQTPVRVLKEIDGFVLNRLQYAIISEAWRLVEEGIVSPNDLDLVMSDGLGMRYAFIGPLETMHLNAEGHVHEGSR